MNEKNIKLIENHYIPCVNWFKISIKETYIKILSSDSYKKMSFRNRCVVVGGAGEIDLSIPLQNGRHQKALYKDVKMANNLPWQKQHWRTLESCYRKSPFWEYYADYFHPFYEKEYAFLFDFNFEIIQLMWRLIDKKKEISAYAFDFTQNNVNDVEVLGSDILPKNYHSENQSFIKYDQLFDDRIGFKPNVSMIDLLCMEGPNTVNLLKY